jgi:hypothetical protein
MCSQFVESNARRGVEQRQADGVVFALIEAAMDPLVGLTSAWISGIRSRCVAEINADEEASASIATVSAS